MGKSKGIKTSKSGLYWCNIILSNGKYKIVIAELIDKENKIFRLRSNSAAVLMDKTWTEMPEKKDWHYKDVFEEDVNEFFNWNY